MVYTKAYIGDIMPGKKVYRDTDYKEYTIKSTIPDNLVSMPFDTLKRGAVGKFKTFKITDIDNNIYTAVFNEAKDEIIIMDDGVIYVLYTDSSHDPGLVNNNNNDNPGNPGNAKGPVPSPVTRSDSGSDPSSVVNHVGGKKSRRRVRRRKNRRTRSRK